MKTILCAFSIQLIVLIALASAFNHASYKSGVNDWANMTAKQFKQR